MNRTKLKEGFLVKKGYVRHNWKTRWFVLFNDALCYYKKNEHMVCVGEVPLRGCSLVAPCPDYTKKLDVFRLITKTGREYLLQAGSEGELQDWSTTIAGAIRETEYKERLEQKSKSCENIDQKQENCELNVKSPLPSFGELVEAMQDKDAGITLETHHVHDNKSYKLCFNGTQVIDWLLSWSFVSTRIEGMRIGNNLLEHGHLQPVGFKSRNSIKQGGIADYVFCDGDNAFYRFSALQLSNNETPESDESSDSEDSDKEQAKSIEGTVIKQGFLVKKGHVRHNWKTRKFVLCEQPAKLYYCKPAKADCPKGFINLNGASVETDESVDEEKKPKQFYGHRFKIRTSKGSQFVMQAGTKEELEEWVLKLKTVCKL